MILLSICLFACSSVNVNAFEFFEDDKDLDEASLFDTRKVKPMCMVCSNIKYFYSSRQLNLTSATASSLIFAPLALLLVSGISKKVI